MISDRRPTAAFATKYGYEASLEVNPSLAQVHGFSMASLLLSGGFTGIFIGKFLRYAKAKFQDMRKGAAS